MLQRHNEDLQRIQNVQSSTKEKQKASLAAKLEARKNLRQVQAKEKKSLLIFNFLGNYQLNKQIPLPEQDQRYKQQPESHSACRSSFDSDSSSSSSSGPSSYIHCSVLQCNDSDTSSCSRSIVDRTNTGKRRRNECVGEDPGCKSKLAVESVMMSVGKKKHF